MKKEKKILFFLGVSFLAASCGLDEPQYIEPVDSGSVTRTSNYEVSFNLVSPESGTVRLNFQTSSTPSINISGTSLGTFFGGYNIYYKIYVSNSNNLSPDESTYSEINPQWSSDYTYYKPLTVTTDTSMIDSRFTADRKYFRINASSGPPLLRASELTAPQPADRNFFYSTDLVDSRYINNANYNADVMTNSSGGSERAWVSMYVVHKGFREDTLTESYGAPTFLGVFLLPNTVNAKAVSVSSISADGSITPITSTSTITFTLSEAISGLTAAQRGSTGNISINDSDPPSALDVKSPETGSLTSSGTTYKLLVANGSTETRLITRNTVSLLFVRNGYSFNPANVNVDVYVNPKPYSVDNQVYPVSFASATATPASGGPTTGITLTFKPPLYGLTPGDILLTDNAGTPVTFALSAAALAGGGTTTTYTITLDSPVVAANNYKVTIDGYPGIFSPEFMNVAVRGP